MNQVLGSSRFWISLVIVVSVTLLAALKIVSGDLAVGTMGGLVGGFGVGKTWGEQKGADDAKPRT